MAVLRTNEIRNMDASEMGDHLTELKGNLMKIRGGLASGGIPENVGQTREIRRTIARILTLKKEKEVSKEKK